MLVCPRCQFENPDSNRFCQKCGASLSDQACPACESPVPFDLEHCPHCGAETGVIWRVIFLPSVSVDPAVLDHATANNSNSSDIKPPMPLIVSRPAGMINLPSVAPSASAHYLDGQQRYKLIEPLPQVGLGEEVDIRVIDCQPFQPSLLHILREQTEPLEPPDANVAVAKKNEIPAIAQVYLDLQQQLYPSLPQIHEAWEMSGQVVLLLEDRAALPSLEEAWQGEQILLLQILHWLYQMVELWVVLAPHQCRQSLLNTANLRVDEDQLLRLQQLYLESPDSMASLSDLGRLWKQLLQLAQPAQSSDLVELCDALASGEITDLEQVRSRLEIVVDQLHPSPSSPAMQPMPLTTATTAKTSMNNLEAIPGEPVVDLEKAMMPAQFDLADLDDDLGGDGDDVPTVVLPMKLVGLEDAGRTDIGRQRDHNEDFFNTHVEIEKIDTPSGRSLRAKGLYVLCDGMGGHAGGEVASAMAVDTLRQYFKANWKNQLPNEQTIREAIKLANKAIYDLNQESARSGSGRMGTTLVLVLVHDTHVAIAHVGDSRLYRFSRRRGLELITVDHEVGQREIQRGVDPAIAYTRPDAYQLTQALGPRDENFINPDVQFMELNEDLLLLLCSDGLTDNDLLEKHWSTHLEPMLITQSNLEQGVNQLIDLANQHNGHDNITAIAIRTKVRPNLEQLRREFF